MSWFRDPTQPNRKAALSFLEKLLFLPLLSLPVFLNYLTEGQAPKTEEQNVWLEAEGKKKTNRFFR